MKKFDRAKKYPLAEIYHEGPVDPSRLAISTTIQCEPLPAPKVKKNVTELEAGGVGNVAIVPVGQLEALLLDALTIENDSVWRFDSAVYTGDPVQGSFKDWGLRTWGLGSSATGWEVKNVPVWMHRLRDYTLTLISPKTSVERQGAPSVSGVAPIQTSSVSLPTNTEGGEKE